MKGIEYLDPIGAGFRENPCASNASADGAARSPVRVEKVGASGWDEIAAAFADVRQEQTSCFNVARWGARRLERALVKRGNDILGAAVVIIVDVPMLRRGLALIKWGPLWRPLGQCADPGRLRDVLAALRREYAQKRGFQLNVFPSADPGFGDVIVKTLKDLGFEPDRPLDHPARYLVNVDIAPEALRQSLGGGWRYNLKKSAAGGLRIAIDDSELALERFMLLYNRMLARKGFRDVSAIATLPALMGSKVEAIRPQIVFAYHEEKPTAGAVLDVSGDQAVYLYGAGDDRALGLRAGYALHWWIAEWLCADPRIRWYDLAGSDGDAGLRHFKKGFAGKKGACPTAPPSYQYSESVFADILGRSIFALHAAKSMAGHAAHRIRTVKAAYGAAS